MFIKAAINGGRHKGEHSAVPLSPAEIAHDSLLCVRAGADIVHAHARKADGSQTIEAADISAMVEAVRLASPDIVIGTTTGLWTVASHADRMRAVESWEDGLLPDFASVAFCEEGAAEAALLVRDRGMVLESAVWSMGDLPALLESPTLLDNVRILIEPEDEDIQVAIDHARRMAQAIRAAGVTVPLLYHGYDETAWPVLEAAIEDGVQVRMGFEDVLVRANGESPVGNADMISTIRGR